MNNFLSKKMIEFYKKKYPSGTKICVDAMADDPNPVESGTIGEVHHVDDIGTLHCIFENGRNIGIIPETDRFHIISE